MNTKTLGLLFCTLVVPAACTTDLGSQDRAIIDTPCELDSDCPSGFECEVEEEHGVVTSYCQANEEWDGTCPDGYEQEVEHGQVYCTPHDEANDVNDDNSSTDDTVVPGDMECQTDADCDPGLECEIQVENGISTSWCQPHGGN